MSKETIARLLLAGICLLLGACGTLYLPKPDEATTLINLRESGSVKICLNGQAFSVGAPLNEEYARFPANVPFTIMSRRVVGETGGVSYSCSPAFGVSLVEPGKKYFLNFEIIKEKCRLELYEETAKSPVGLLPILPVSPETCR